MSNRSYTLLSSKHHLRNFYSVEIVVEEGSKRAYFNSKIHVDKRVTIGPAYSLEFGDQAILRDIIPYIETRYPDAFYCPTCGK